MNLLKDLKELAGEFAEVSIIPRSKYRREANNKNADVKDVFTVKMLHRRFTRRCLQRAIIYSPSPY